jgi:hypothetical protein
MLDAVIRRLARLKDEAHGAVAINVGQRNAHTSVVSVSGPGGGRMSEEEITKEELEEHGGEPLPERTQMSIVTPGHGPMPIGWDVPPGAMDPAPTPGPVDS